MQLEFKITKEMVFDDGILSITTSHTKYTDTYDITVEDEAGNEYYASGNVDDDINETIKPIVYDFEQNKVPNQTQVLEEVLRQIGGIHKTVNESMNVDGVVIEAYGVIQTPHGKPNELFCFKLHHPNVIDFSTAFSSFESKCIDIIFDVKSLDMNAEYRYFEQLELDDISLRIPMLMLVGDCLLALKPFIKID